MHALDALGNPVRRAILHELRARPLSVGEIAAGLPVSRPAVSRHLRVLEDAGLVQTREEGTRNLYSVRMQGFASVQTRPALVASVRPLEFYRNRPDVSINFSFHNFIALRAVENCDTAAGFDF